MGEQWRRALVIGIIGSTLFALLVQPLLGFIGTGLIRMSGLVSEALSDSVYRKAATGADHAAGAFFLQGYLAAVLLASSFAFGFMFWAQRPSRLGKALREVPKWVPLAAAVFALLLGLVYLSSAAIDLATAKAIATFHQRLAILDPVLEDMERRKLLAAWASMRTRRDYQSINESIERYATMHGISNLPKP